MDWTYCVYLPANSQLHKSNSVLWYCIIYGIQTIDKKGAFIAREVITTAQAAVWFQEQTSPGATRPRSCSEQEQ
jgi:hypothetical protein